MRDSVIDPEISGKKTFEAEMLLPWRPALVQPCAHLTMEMRWVRVLLSGKSLLRVPSVTVLGRGLPALQPNATESEQSGQEHT